MSHTRRELLLHGLLGAGGIGLRALATGLPAAFLLNSAAAAPVSRATDRGPAEAEANAQFLILSTSSAGDPVNTNTPGTYEHPAIQHSADPRMARTALRLGRHPTSAAAPWAALPQPILDRTVFFHHSTLTQSHPHHPRVLELLGATADAESAPALFGRHLATRLGTTQAAPLLVGTTERINAGGRSLPRLSCRELSAALTQGNTPLGNLAQLRDHGVDAAHRQLRTHGTPAQRAYLDRHARSRAETQALADRLLADLSAVRDDSVAAQVTTAAALIRLNATPVVIISIPFGGDNHFDYEFTEEAAQTVTGVAHIHQLQQKLGAYGLSDRTTFALLNVFGRTLQRHGRAGRDHWAAHHTAVIIGKPFAPGIIGGLEPHDDDFAATAIQSRTGAAAPTGTASDIPPTETLPALAKTLGRGLGLPQELLDHGITQGRTVPAALV